MIKFLFSLLAFSLMNKNIGFMTKLTEPYIPLVLALVCSFLPYGAISFLAAGFMLAHLSGISLEITLVMAVFIVVVGLLYYGFQPGDSYLLVLTPVFFLLKIPYAIPLIVGLSGSVISVIPVSCGVFIYYTLLYVKQNAGVLTNDMSVDQVVKFMQLMKVLLSNKLMLVMVTAFALSLVVVAVTRSLSMDYSWIIAIVAAWRDFCRRYCCRCICIGNPASGRNPIFHRNCRDLYIFCLCSGLFQDRIRTI